MFRPRLPLTLIATLNLLALATIAGCGDNASTSTTTPDAGVTPAAWQLDAAPDGAVDIIAAKATAQAGDTIAIRGKIGGRMQPLSPASGLIVLMDDSVPSCADNPGDSCSTPWDYCCETPETLTAGGATVQVRDADGNPVALPEGALSELDELVVVGTVAPRANDQTLVLLASGVYVASEFDAAGHADHVGHNH